MEPEERARLAFLAFQHPSEIPGVSNLDFWRVAYNSRARQGLDELIRLILMSGAGSAGEDESASRSVNEGSGGEKSGEILQMAPLEPKVAILDETDSLGY